MINEVRQRIVRFVTPIVVIAVASGCSTVMPPSPLSEIEAAEIIFGLEREHPRERIYRQYVSNNQYLQFERIGEQDVLYGWRTCTTCNWTRLPMSAIYTGDYLYTINGHHEDFFLTAPEDQRLVRDNQFRHWSWNTVSKYQVEGRNLIQLSQFRACSYNTPRVQEWSNAPWSSGDEIDCRYKRSGSYNRLWVATIDETLAGERDSIVDTVGGSSVQERLNALEALLRDGVITEKEYAEKRRDILDDI